MPRRKVALRRRRTVLVWFGGLRTEPEYFDGLRRAVRRSDLTIKTRKGAEAPDALVRAAAMFRDRRPGVFDEVWCVVDVDEFDVGAAAVEARRHGVSLAVSNPCFEFWLLLHHAPCRAHCAGCSDVLRLLRKELPAYDKAKLKFEHFVGRIDDAVKRARELDPTGNDYYRNPSTNVWRLVQLIRERSDV